MRFDRNDPDKQPRADVLTPVAQYLRKSDDHQKYSTENQSEANHAYATAHGMEIVQTYADQGISGLTFEKRGGLKRLIADVQGGGSGFKAILVYDVSRWGRYQDVDESAHYEFICRRSGIAVHYCAEQFANDGSPFSSLVKGWKRAMAGEYSRELSVKVFNGQTRLARLGYKVGGSAVYGFRRLLIDQNGVPKCTLAHGERKSIASDRVVLVPGPSEEIATVQVIFGLFVQHQKNERAIARILNTQGRLNARGKAWSSGTIRRMLCNEAYIGNNIWNRNSFKLQTAHVHNEPEQWIRAEAAFPAIVDRSLFETAQIILRTRGNVTITGRPRKLPANEMLRRLSNLLETRGTLSLQLINEHKDLPSADAYNRRFGGLKRAFQLLGMPYRRRGFTRIGRPTGISNDEMLDILRQLWKEHGHLTAEIIRKSPIAPSVVSYLSRFGSLRRAYQRIGFVPERERRMSNEAVLDILRDLLRQHGRLSRPIIDRSETGLCYATIAYRFGGLLRAYALVGYTSNWHCGGLVRPQGFSEGQMLEALRMLLQEHGYLSKELIRRVMSVPSYYEYCKRFGSLSAAYHLIGFTKKTRIRARRSAVGTGCDPA